MRSTRRFTLFLLIVSMVLSMSVLHVFAEGEDTAAPAETAEVVETAFSTDPAAMTYDDAVALLEYVDTLDDGYEAYADQTSSSTRKKVPSMQPSGHCSRRSSPSVWL